MNTVHKITTQEKHVIGLQPFMSKRHNDIIDVIIKKITIKYDIF